MNEELKEWLGIRPADLVTYAAAAAVVGMYFNQNVILDIALSTAAVSLCVVSCATGMRPNPRLSAFSNFNKRVSYPACLIAVIVCIYLNFNLWQRPTDANLRAKLIGNWTRKGLGIATFTPDGSFSSAWTNLNTKPAKAWMYGGRWEVRNGACLITTTKTDAWNATNSQSIGGTEHWKIIRLSDTNLVWELNGQRVFLTRRNS